MRNLFFAILLFLTVGIAAQTNPSTIDLEILKGQPFTYTLIGDFDVVNQSPILTEGDYNSATNSYTFNFQSENLGLFTGVYKYSESGQVYYTTFNLEVVESIVATGHDYQEIELGETAIVDVLSNDNTSAQNLDVVDIPFSQNGSASILGDFIEFVPEEGFTGLAYVSYVVEDDMGSRDLGMATIHVVDGADAFSVINEIYFVQLGDDLDIVIPSSSTRNEFGSTTLGKLTSLQNGVLRYSAGSKSGVDVVSFNVNGEERSFEIHVLDRNENHGFVRDDIVYTSMNESVTFDVFENDLESFSISNKSPELKLVSPGSGLLVYNPPLGYQGVQNFFYEVSDGENSVIGNIEVVVNDNLPETRIYEFTTRENTPFLIQHKLTTQGNINVVQSPQNGILRYRETGFFYCGGQIGPNNLVYDPNDGFVGQDFFELEYCSDGGSCVVLEIVIDVEANSEECNCIGEDCVWPGDTDGDGLVTVSDILPIGLLMGDKGSARSETGSDWNALFTEEWSGKNADTNGDGQVNIEDVTAVEENYSELHTLQSPNILSIKEVPFYALPRQTSGSKGDLLIIDLFVGTSEIPLKNTNGIAFNFSIPPVYLEEGSLNFEFTPSEWFGYNNATISTIQYPSLGRVDAAISRSGGIDLDGSGQIGTLGVVLQEEFDDFKPEGNQIPIEIKIGGGEYQSTSGEKFGLEGSSTTVFLDLNTQNVAQEIEIITFPNPADQSLTIHANNQDVIQNIFIYNGVGQAVGIHTNVLSNHFEINTSTLSEGFYMARVETLLGVSVEKIQVVR